jgi:hypothetical protein
VKIRAYASRTGTKRNLEGLRAAGWGLLLSAYGVHRDEGWDDIMLDPGTWSTRTGEAWDERRFVDLLDVFGRRSAQTLAPDIVAGGLASLELSLGWLDTLVDLGRPVMIVAQDGMDIDDLRPHVGENVGIAVGGSTTWKWATVSKWARLAGETGCRLHVLRCNSARMVRYAASLGAYSFDGSGPSKFAQHLAVVEGGRKPVNREFALDLPAPFTPREQSFNPKKKKS